MPVRKQPHGIVATGAAPVTPADGADLAVAPCTALVIGVAGNLAVVTADGDTVTLFNIPAGVLPLSVTRVLATGTTAQNISALY